MKKQILLIMLFALPNLANARSVQDMLDAGENIPFDVYGILDLSNKNLTSLDGLENISNIERCGLLNASNNQITNIIGSFDNLALVNKLNIICLDLSNNQIVDISSTFDKFPNLSSLSLNNNQITNIFDAFNNLASKNLLHAYLDLSNNFLSEEDQAYLQGFCDAKGIKLKIDNQTPIVSSLLKLKFVD